MAPKDPKDLKDLKDVETQITRDLIKRTDRMFEDAETLQRRARAQLREHFTGKDDLTASSDADSTDDKTGR